MFQKFQHRDMAEDLASFNHMCVSRPTMFFLNLFQFDTFIVVSTLISCNCWITGRSWCIYCLKASSGVMSDWNVTGFAMILPVLLVLTLIAGW